MQFRSFDATFGNLEHCALTLAPGLNVVEAPNESGKSTLAAFLRTMLYGLQTRERGAYADKNRFAPWSGSAMCGTLMLAGTEFGDVTITRDTARASSPMGRFSAVYAGTGEPVAALSAADCGERLLGIPREVYERSAFIRQSGLTIDANAELERRIAALITTGEEGSSYSEVAGALKKQLNARRHNKTGLIPALEQELAQTSTARAELAALESQRADAEAELAALQGEMGALRRELVVHDLADRREQFEAQRAAKRVVDETNAKVGAVRELLRAAGTPAREMLEQGKAQLSALAELETSLQAAQQQCVQSERALAAFDAQRKGGQKAVFYLFAVLTLGLCAAAGLSRQLLLLLPAFAAAFAAVLLRKRHARDEQERAALEAGAQKARAGYEALRSTYDTQSAALLALIPAQDAARADAYIKDALSRYALLAQLQSAAQAAQLQYTLACAQGACEAPCAAVARPSRSRDELLLALSNAEARTQDLRRTADYTSGRIRAIGEPVDLDAALSEKHAQLDALQEEYDALALAMEALERANTTLQNRFSPALGRRAAELFSALTGGKYHTVLLDRSFHALTGEEGSPVSRDAALLSQGAADQLYLAVRLAICELVLPEEQCIPLVLDDALINFDDVRCAAALELLLSMSETRQILLLTCQHREAALLRGHAGVNLLSLSE